MGKQIIILGYKLIRKVKRNIFSLFDKFRCCLKFIGNGVNYSSFQTNGIPYVMVAIGGRMSIGKNFTMNNNINGNPIGCYDKCTFFVDSGAELVIGDNVGISQSALVSLCSITIGNNVKMGGGTSLYTTDFHSLNPRIRAGNEDIAYRKNAPIEIGDNVFIGAKCIILKGVKIGANSVVGAGSVVTKPIPPNEIWAGNPAKFIRKVE